MGIGQGSLDSRTIARTSAIAVAAVVVVLAIVLAVVAAANPPAGLASAVVLALLAAAARRPAAASRLGRWALATAALIGLVVLVAVAPGAAILVLAGTIAAALVRGAVLAPEAASAWAQRLAKPAVVVLAVGAVVAAAGWPITSALVAAVVAGAVLARRAPAWALAIGLLMIGFEGSIKILLGLESSPLPWGNREMGAAAIDLVIFGAVAGVIVSDRLATPKRVWHAATRAERVVIAVLGGWLGLSVLQMAQGGDVARGIEGFRLFQAYTAVAIAALIVFAVERHRFRAAQVVLAIGLVVSFYAAFRVIFGVTEAESLFATSVRTVIGYGRALRAVGSFSSSVGLVSFLSPLAVFALVVGYAEPRLRRLAWAAGVLALVGLIGSYGRASLVGVALGLVCAFGVLVATADTSRRRKWTAAGLVVMTLAATYGAVQVVSSSSPQLRERARGLRDPLNDKSVQLRFETWGDALEAAAHKPFGQGVGAIGGSSKADRDTLATTDNSYLKVVVEQGMLVGAAFIAALIGAVVLLVRRLRWAAPDARALGVAALAGFVAFLGISISGEYVDQPGKVIAWGLLGVAVATAMDRARPDGRRKPPEGAP
jgi:O-Antigen ligase